MLGMSKATQPKQAEYLFSAFWAQPCPRAFTDAASPSHWLDGLGRLFLDLKGAGQGGLVSWVPLQVRVSQQAECP